MSDSIMLGNCPECGHFPSQLVGDDQSLKCVIHLPKEVNCKAGPHSYIQGLESELTAARDEAERLRGILHAREMHPDFEYAATHGPRKAWYDEDVSPEGDGWEPNKYKGRDGWDRFDYHEEAYWMRLRTRATESPHPAPTSPSTTDQ